jgi:hypothetical protein
LPNGSVVKRDLSFWEIYGKVTVTVNDQLAVGASVYYSPSVLNTHAPGIYVEGTPNTQSRPPRSPRG